MKVKLRRKNHTVDYHWAGPGAAPTKIVDGKEAYIWRNVHRGDRVDTVWDKWNTNPNHVEQVSFIRANAKKWSFENLRQELSEKYQIQLTP